ncbi:TIGR04086 family membrane protein [Paramaledivibacter caminithermalis]|uniref:Putative membrane protein, TIGR04086 family n=1 Tax=Paramaledivibacter caminithermalis (strain DSM 15212 / CIP 107654 / DViRD3) TaxID=1121301 RepID=A0A1M6JX90_PARC5|nr:TIGR04086 family membrane protein [Paramaledivibacter caminithermalis]SHJ51288.1 putative membrane protein, TIGR04086 family [Paramaledivibacter caminithermalis DSM 15212]
MAKAKILNNKEKMPRLTYFRSIFKALVYTLIIMLISAAIITFTSVPESIIPFMTFVIMVLSIAFSGLLSARVFQKNGFMHGLVTGSIYILFIVFLSWIFIDDFTIDKYLVLKAVIGIVSGGVGGIIGVNIK